MGRGPSLLVAWGSAGLNPELPWLSRCRPSLATLASRVSLPWGSLALSGLETFVGKLQAPTTAPLTSHCRTTAFCGRSRCPVCVPGGCPCGLLRNAGCSRMNHSMLPSGNSSLLLVGPPRDGVLAWIS